MNCCITWLLHYTAAGDSSPIAIIYSRGLSELSGAFDSYVIAISADSSAISLIAILDSYRVAIAPTDELLS